MPAPILTQVREERRTRAHRQNRGRGLSCLSAFHPAAPLARTDQPHRLFGKSLNRAVADLIGPGLHRAGVCRFRFAPTQSLQSHRTGSESHQSQVTCPPGVCGGGLCDNVCPVLGAFVVLWSGGHGEHGVPRLSVPQSTPFQWQLFTA